MARTARKGAAAAAPRIVYVCAHGCGDEYPQDYHSNWGVNGLGSGYGPVPVCTCIVTDPRTNAGAVCRGPLIPQIREDGEIEPDARKPNGAFDYGKEVGDGS